MSVMVRIFGLITDVAQLPQWVNICRNQTSARLSRNAALNDSQFKSRFIDLGGVPTPMSTANFSNFIEAETEKWAKVVKFSGAKAE